MMLTWELDLILTTKLYRDGDNVVNHLNNSILESNIPIFKLWIGSYQILSIRNSDRKKASRDCNSKVLVYFVLKVNL